MNTFFTIGQHSYVVDKFGVHQLAPDPYVYDEKYCSTYDTPEYVKGNDILQALRLGFIIGAHGKIPKSILDVGYGNGAFLRRCQGTIKELYGLDVSGVKLDFITTVKEFIPVDVITFHDCLEHIQNLSFIRHLICDTIIISLPYCHFTNIEWFSNWKHRKPNEHVHHFNPEALNYLMKEFGYRKVALSYHEDIVRKGTDSPNIFSMAFKKG